MQNKHGNNLLYPCNYNYLGVSLLEFLLAMVLGVFLLFVLVSTYHSLKITWQLQQALEDIQENGRFVSYYLSQKIRSAGENSCQSDIQSPDFVHGYSAATMQQLLPGRLLLGTDVLSLYECVSHEQTTQYLPIFYFIADTLRKDKRGIPIYSLYEKRGDSPSQELVENISNMQIQYGLKLNDKASLVYEIADHIDNWSNVCSMNVKLKFNSNEPTIYKTLGIYATIRKEFAKP